MWMMANLSIINILPNHVANIYIKLKSITSKLHNPSASIAFIKKALFVEVIPKNSDHLIQDFFSRWWFLFGSFVIFRVDFCSVKFEYISWNYWNLNPDFSNACLEKLFCKNSYQIEPNRGVVAPWCSGYHYCTTSFS